MPDRGDRIFRAGTRVAGVVVVGVIGAVGVFLAILAYPALSVAKWHFLTTQAWEPDIHHFGIGGVLPDTVLIALVAIVVAMPISLGLALFISEIAPKPVQRVMVTIVDLMAAVPSVVYALWALDFLQGHVVDVARWLSTWLGWIPFFKVSADSTNPLASPSYWSASTFVVGLAVSLMVIPIQCSVMREAFSQAPLGEREAAYALGSNRWGMIRSVVLPFGRGGIIGGTMLGLGRALGETIVVYLIISPVFTINWHVLQSGGNSISALIALQNPDADSFGRSALMAAGLALFVMTLGINFVASAIVARSRSGAQSDG
ncbi:MAG: phosphate ABC transporter permease subunit PstC [Acidimicrobiales bacterium]